MTLLEFFQQYPTAYLISAGILGALVGSFLNVVIYRLPIMLKHDWQAQCYEFLNEYEPDCGLKKTAPESARFNLIVPRSHCPSCQVPVAAIDNIPLFSYLFLKGRCRHCKTKIGLRYPLVELITALLTALAAYYTPLGWHFLLLAVLTWGLIALTLIDYDHQLLPDSIVLSLLWLALLYSPYNAHVTPEQSIIGAAFGYGILWLVTFVFKLITGKQGMGHGDFKLLAVFGAWLGWQAIALIILLSSFVGAVIGISLIVFKGRDRNKPIPFGPYLAIAGLIAIYWGDAIIKTYINYAGIR